MTLAMKMCEARYAKRAFAAMTLAVGAAACSTTPKDAAPAAPSSSAPSSPAYLMADILGASPDAVDDLLGAPSLSRREGAGEYRRYRLSQCMLIVILYPDETGAQRVAHVDAAALKAGDDAPAADACLATG